MRALDRDVAVGARRASSLAPRLFAVFLFLHGFAHVVGTTGSLTAIDEGKTLPYLAGRWEVSDPSLLRGLAVLWAVAALGYLVVAIAMWLRLPWRRPALIAVTAYSLVLSVAALWAAVIGAIIDVVLLVVAIPKRGRIHRAPFASSPG